MVGKRILIKDKDMYKMVNFIEVVVGAIVGGAAVIVILAKK